MVGCVLGGVGWGWGGECRQERRLHIGCVCCLLSGQPCAPAADGLSILAAWLPRRHGAGGAAQPHQHVGPCAAALGARQPSALGWRPGGDHRRLFRGPAAGFPAAGALPGGRAVHERGRGRGGWWAGLLLGRCHRWLRLAQRLCAQLHASCQLPSDVHPPCPACRSRAPPPSLTLRLPTPPSPHPSPPLQPPRQQAAARGRRRPRGWEPPAPPPG